MKKNIWNEIWKNKKIDIYDKNISVLQSLILADGFDGKTGYIDEKDWIEYINLLKKYFFNHEKSIYEVGCGSGAFLYPFYCDNYVVGGVDYSENLIKIAKSFMPSCDFTYSEASNLDVNKKYDYVVSHSVFFYFEDYDYAEIVLDKMIKKARHSILVFDVPDFNKKELCEYTRKSTYPSGEYEKRYKNLGHLYYKKEWFKKFEIKHRVKISFYEQELFFKNYGNSKFRYNVLIEKIN